MTDEERFEVILAELGRLVLQLGDLAQNFVVIGGQVVALEDRARGRSGHLRVQLPTGPTIERGFSLDLDLLYDGGAEFLDERIPAVLRQLDYERSGARWKKEVDGVVVAVDLLFSPETDPATLPTEMTLAAGGELAARRLPRHLALSLSGLTVEVPVPDPIGFLSLKLAAKRVRPALNKDCFDIFAYVHLVGVEEVDRKLRTVAEGPGLREDLRELFGSEDGAGVADILAYAPTLDADESALIVRGVLDLFEPLCSQ